MAYFSLTFMVAMIVPDSSSTRVISSFFLSELANSAVAERVTGTGQNVPSAILYLSQTPFQSFFVMKPVSGVKAPMPIITRSAVSREEILSCFRVLAFFCSF